MAATTAPRRPATPYVAPVTITAFELEVVDFGVDADEPDDEPPAGAVVVGLLAAVVPVPVVAATGVDPALVAAVAGVADPFKQLVSPVPG
jgi:hypothetical protein